MLYKPKYATWWKLLEAGLLIPLAVLGVVAIVDVGTLAVAQGYEALYGLALTLAYALLACPGKAVR